MNNPPLTTNVLFRINGLTTEAAGDSALMRGLLRDISASLGLQVLNEAFHQFAPRGVTGVLLLAESHIAVHTWPEHNHAVVELLTCKPFGQPEQALLEAELHRKLGDVMLAITINR